MRYRRIGQVILFAAALTFAAGPVLAQGRGHGNGEGNGRGEQEHGRGRGHEKEHGRKERSYFRNSDRDAIAAYYRDHRRDLPPGLAKRESLPPGLERQLRRNGRLPPGLQKRIVWFPRALDRRLGPLPAGYRRCWVGNNVLVVNVRTFAIADVMLNFTFALR